MCRGVQLRPQLSVPELGIRQCLTSIAQNKGGPNKPQSLLPGVLPRSRVTNKLFEESSFDIYKKVVFHDVLCLVC